MEGIKFTRKDFMSDKCSYEEYYAQFCSPAVRNCVLIAIGLKDILASTDPHLNDIDLRKWTNIKLPIETLTMLTEANGHKVYRKDHKTVVFTYAKSDIVCITKMAAKIICKEHKGDSNV